MQAANQISAPAGSPDTCPTVICLHSSASTSKQWQGLHDSWPNSHVISPSLVGYGKAGWTGDQHYSMSAEVKAIERVIDQVSHPVHLVGHSFGGAVALMTALSRPDRVKSLVVYEPVLFPLLFATGKPSGQEIWQLQTEVRRLVRQGETALATRRFIDYWNRSETYTQLNERTKNNVIRSMPKVASEFGALISIPIMEDELKALKVPTLLLYGKESPEPTRDITAVLRSLLSRCNALGLDGMGHMGPITCPSKVNPIIKEFVDYQTIVDDAPPRDESMVLARNRLQLDRPDRSRIQSKESQHDNAKQSPLLPVGMKKQGKLTFPTKRIQILS